MYALIVENSGTLLVGTIVAGVLLAVVVKLLGDRKRRKSTSCACGCCGCSKDA
ncbi:MAG: FeoB-associated Cys-rich membrane protein [Desulfovibrio sp.]|jgi:hypothetical protein|nr:FeoB-associated Cys-rich membrane protein [Desulfovibrio sp.]